MDPRVWIWKFGTRCRTRCGVSSSHTHRDADFHLFACSVEVFISLYLEWSKMAMKFCTKFLCNSFSTYFFAPFPCRDFSWFSLLKQGMTIAHRFCFVPLCLYLYPNSLGPHGELSMHVPWNSHSLLLRHNSWQGGSSVGRLTIIPLIKRGQIKSGFVQKKDNLEAEKDGIPDQ